MDDIIVSGSENIHPLEVASGRTAARYDRAEEAADLRIMYGVAGDGLGHATRSRVVIDELAREHELLIATMSDGFRYLSERTPPGSEIWELPSDEPPGSKLERRAEVFRPEAVLTDLEPATSRYALLHSIPLVSVDHIHAIDRCRHDPGLVHGHESELWLNKQQVGGKVPDATHYVITSFFFPLLVEPRTTLVPPILRPEVLAARKERGDHLLVYRSDASQDDLSPALAASGLPCRVYGLRSGFDHDLVEGALTYRPFSESGFVDDLRTARAVVCGGSFTLLGEALHLGKPVLACPTAGHFGHLLNALYVDRLGYGLYASETSSRSIEDFMEREPALRDRLSAYRQDGNDEALDTIRRVLETVAATRRRTRRLSVGSGR